MGRPPIGEKAMTATERVRLHRERKRTPQTVPDDPLARAFHGKSNKLLARYLGCSERHYYTIQQYNRFKAFDWDSDILEGKYGRCGMSFIADVCKHSNAEAQRLIHDDIKEEGAAYARQLWKTIKREAAANSIITNRG